MVHDEAGDVAEAARPDVVAVAVAGGHQQVVAPSAAVSRITRATFGPRLESVSAGRPSRATEREFRQLIGRIEAELGGE